MSALASRCYSGGTKSMEQNWLLLARSKHSRTKGGCDGLQNTGEPGVCRDRCRDS